MTRRERTLVTATVAAALLGGTLWGYARLVAAREAAGVAARNLEECRRLAARIGPTPVEAAPEGTADGKAEDDVIRRIESSARSADFPESSIERIEPAPPERVGDGPFLKRPTVVQLRGVTLRQLFTFLHAAGAGRSRLGVDQIRLSAPASAADGAGDTWSVDATLTQLVRAPAAADDSRGREE